eukprot:m.153162 g.153162  ORF g.153162 m.153162 type:complete len:277 (+) comp38619_c0_seq18:2523-3353(+)
MVCCFLAYEQKVVAFFKQPDIEEVLMTKAADSYIVVKNSVTEVARRGEPAVKDLANNFEFVLLLSQLENEIASFVPGITPAMPESPVISPAKLRTPVPYRRDFDSKLREFHNRLAKSGYAKGPAKIQLQLRRANVLEDANGRIMAQTSKQLKQSKLYVSFVGEEGLDYGGLSREFFFLISREIFNPYYGLFEYSANDCYTVQISPMSAFVDNAIEWFRFCGRILGLCVIHQCLLDAFFTRPFYKALLQKCSAFFRLYLFGVFPLQALDSQRFGISG